ncbi:MAG: nuclear transport factor 2 family protein [Kangiellaceae bacterium]|nr:nuclear transport factor 2 family protein [Kangiellaceae bacterium]
MSSRFNFKYCLSGILATIAATVCQASESPSSTVEQSNLKKAVYCMEILESRNDLAPSTRIEILRNECYSENFTEHAPHIKDGREALFSFFTGLYKKYPELSMSIKRSASDSDLVWLHLHVKHTPEARGRAAIQIFKMKDGKIVEHWGVGTSVPEKSLNDNTMF